MSGQIFTSTLDGEPVKKCQNNSEMGVVSLVLEGGCIGHYNQRLCSLRCWLDHSNPENVMVSHSSNSVGMCHECQDFFPHFHNISWLDEKKSSEEGSSIEKPRMNRLAAYVRKCGWLSLTEFFVCAPLRRVRRRLCWMVEPGTENMINMHINQVKESVWYCLSCLLVPHFHFISHMHYFCSYCPRKYTREQTERLSPTPPRPLPFFLRLSAQLPYFCLLFLSKHRVP